MEKISIDIDIPVKAEDLSKIVNYMGFSTSPNDFIDSIELEKNETIDRIYVGVDHGQIYRADEYEKRDSASEEEIEELFKLSDLKNLYDDKKETQRCREEFNDSIFKSHDPSFEYRMLSRLKMDCEYYLGNGARHAPHLWAGNEKDHIGLMQALYMDLKEKPEWLSLNQMLKFKDDMLNTGKEKVLSDVDKKNIEKDIEIISVNGLDSEVSEAAQEHFDYLYDMYAQKYGENFTNRVDYHTDIRPKYNNDLKREAQMFLQNDREKVQETKEEKVVGAIIYHDTGERVEFTDEKQYLQHIKDDLYVLGDGFHTETVKRDAELHKAVDDMLYGEYAVENPHDLKYYENKLGIEKKGTVDNKKRISDVNIFSLNTGGMAIRCKIDGEQQSAVKMTKQDVNNLNEKSDRIGLAEKYFKEQLTEEKVEINNSFKR